MYVATFSDVHCGKKCKKNMLLQTVADPGIAGGGYDPSPSPSSSS